MIPPRFRSEISLRISIEIILANPPKFSSNISLGISLRVSVDAHIYVDLYWRVPDIQVRWNVLGKI